MSDRLKYSINGVYRCENFQQLLTQNEFPEFPMIPIGSAGGVDGWYIMFRVELINNERFVNPWIYCHNPKPTFLLRRFFNIIKKDGSSVFKFFDRHITISGFGPQGVEMKVTALLDRENGYLDDNGGLTVEYGIHVDSILSVDGVWKFNLNDVFFNPDDNLTIEYGDPVDGPPKVLYGHKQLLRFYSPLFQKQVNKFSPTWTARLIEECIQIAHGVRIPLDDDTLLKISRIAHRNKLRNVVQYVDEQLVETHWRPDPNLLNPSAVLLFDNCVERGLRHFLAHLVRHFECLEDLKATIRQLDIPKMSGEAMKTFTAKIFKLGT